MAFLPAEVFSLLQKARARDRLPHALLLTGPAGSGKRALALEIAAMANGLTPATLKLSRDFHTLEPESKSRRILVENLREFSARFQFSATTAGGLNTGIIFEADRMQDAAANAFLKTLEEPPPRCLFVLTTTNPRLLPATIVSRCTHLPLRPPPAPAPEQGAHALIEALEQALTAPAGQRERASLFLAATLSGRLQEERSRLAAESEAAFREERRILGDNADDAWLKHEEARLGALNEARAQEMRNHLLALLSERVADILRARHGVPLLHFPSRAHASRELAGRLEDSTLLRALEACGNLRTLLERNVREDLAIQASCLALTSSP